MAALILAAADAEMSGGSPHRQSSDRFGVNKVMGINANRVCVS